MIKLLVTGLVLYFFYKFMFRPSLNQGNTNARKEAPRQEEEIEIRRSGGNPRNDRGEFIDYEEVE